MNRGKKVCGTCAYSAYYDGTTLECRRHAPVAPIREDMTQFPLVGCNDFCGDYEPNDAQESDGATVS